MAQSGEEAITHELPDQVGKGVYEKELVLKEEKKNIPEKTELTGDYNGTNKKHTMPITCRRYCAAGRLNSKCQNQSIETCFTCPYGCTDYVMSYHTVNKMRLNELN